MKSGRQQSVVAFVCDYEFTLDELEDGEIRLSFGSVGALFAISCGASKLIRTSSFQQQSELATQDTS